MGLNPYSTGSWVAGSIEHEGKTCVLVVLILILLEVGLLANQMANQAKCVKGS